VVFWLLSLTGAYLLGRQQTPPPVPPPSAGPDSGVVGQPATAAALYDGGSRADDDWHALAASARANDTLSQLLTQAQELAAQGRVHDALALVDAYLALDHASAALFVRSDLLMMNGQQATALEPLLKILDYPDSPAVAERARTRLNLIINAYEQQLINSGDVAGLVDFFAKLAAREPAYDRHRLKLALWLLRAGDLEAAQSLSRQLGRVGVTELEVEALNREIALAASPVPFERVGPGYFAEVRVHGGRFRSPRSLRLLVDTGATTTGLSADLLHQLGATELERKVRVNTAGGITEMATYRVSGLQIGETHVGELTVLALPAAPHGADGLLGMDVLDQLPKPVGTP